MDSEKTHRTPVEQSLTIFKKPLSEYLTNINPQGINDIIKSEAGQISVLIHQRGKAEVTALIANEIINTCKYFNFPRTMDRPQVMETTDLLIQAFPIFTPEDFIICFKNIKMLKYGRLYEGIDGGKIMEMFRAYDEEREQEIVKLRQKEIGEYKAQGRQLNEVTVEIIKKFTKLEPEPIEESEKPEDPVRDLMNQYYTEFDKLYSEQNPFGSGMRFVKYAGKDLDVSGFCNVRFNEDNAL